MMTFAREQTADIDNPKPKRRTDLLFIKLCSEVGDQDGLRKHINDLKSRGELSLNEYPVISFAALKAKDREMAPLYSRLLLQRNTAATVRSEAGDQVLSEEQVNDAIDQNRCLGLLGY
jgi:hypothetical protein